MWKCFHLRPFVGDHCFYNMEVADSCLWKSSALHFSKIYDTVYGLYEKGRLWPYVKQALLRSSIAESRNCSQFFYGSLSYRISTISLERLMGCLHGKVRLYPYVCQALLERSRNCSFEFSHYLTN
jgi:hypothetical protein